MPKIEKLFAFIAEDSGPNDEGVVAVQIPGSSIWMPLIGADMDRIESLRPKALEIAAITGKRITLTEFSKRTDIEELIT